MKLAIVAGEASGDLHASEVVGELKKLDAGLEMFGIGGDLLAAHGMTLLHHAREMGIVGLFNVLRHLPMFRRVFNELVDRIAQERPDAVLLVDYPDFNLRVAKRCKELGLRVVYYISPQLWAWRQGRVRHIAKYVDRMVVIFPFEEDFYRKHNVPVTYVGHPLIEQLGAVQRPERNLEELRIALLPGSRRMEVQSLLPPMLDAVELLRSERKVHAFVMQAPTIARETLERIMRERGIEVPILPNDRGEGVASADVALSSSGTATLESAILGTPVVVMYRLSRANYMLAKTLVRLPHFSLVNIVAGQRVVPELLQDEVNGERIASEVRVLVAPERYDLVRAQLAEVRGKLGEPGAARRVAEEIARLAKNDAA
ncbi:MAG TPA: lipid-A-disaccharide synthase [Thermoanaerobaculia bacterium]|nr:lipid-A-disaccharide synthase [Thermoanaerobaculia bacterium]